MRFSCRQLQSGAGFDALNDGKQFGGAVPAGVPCQDRGAAARDQLPAKLRVVLQRPQMALHLVSVASYEVVRAGREEALGMDVTYHGEEAYATGEGAILVSPESGIDEPVLVRAS